MQRRTCYNEEETEKKRMTENLKIKPGEYFYVNLLGTNSSKTLPKHMETLYLKQTISKQTVFFQNKIDYN